MNNQAGGGGYGEQAGHGEQALEPTTASAAAAAAAADGEIQDAGRGPASDTSTCDLARGAGLAASPLLSEWRLQRTRPEAGRASSCAAASVLLARVGCVPACPPTLRR